VEHQRQRRHVENSRSSDPYIYSGNEKKDEEPEYNVKGFKSAVEVAFHLKDLLDE
jgi:hypothetical protein